MVDMPGVTLFGKPFTYYITQEGIKNTGSSQGKPDKKITKAIENGSNKLGKLLKTYDGDVGGRSLYKATKAGNHKTLKVLLDDGRADDYDNAIIYAVKNGDKMAAELISRYNPESTTILCGNLLKYALIMKDYDVANRLDYYGDFKDEKIIDDILEYIGGAR
jgi:hypothetical protein